jgi:hypothetical protein
MITEAELLKEVLHGMLLIVGEYRGSRVESAGYVSHKSGDSIKYIRATHLLECVWAGHFDRVTITQAFPESFPTVEAAEASFNYIKGRRYVFYLDSFKRERGHTFARMGAWDAAEIEQGAEAVAPPSGGATAP